MVVKTSRQYLGVHVFLWKWHSQNVPIKYNGTVSLFYCPSMRHNLSNSLKRERGCPGKSHSSDRCWNMLFGVTTSFPVKVGSSSTSSGFVRLGEPYLLSSPPPYPFLGTFTTTLTTGADESQLQHCHRQPCSGSILQIRCCRRVPLGVCCCCPRVCVYVGSKSSSVVAVVQCVP